MRKHVEELVATGAAAGRGRGGRFSVGALNITTDRDDVAGVRRTNFTVVRLRRDILRRSNVGALMTLHSQSLERPGEASAAFGLESSFALLDDVTAAAFFSRAETPGLGGGKNSYGASFGFTPDLYGFKVEHQFIDDNFNPEVGFVRRDKHPPDERVRTCESSTRESSYDSSSVVCG